MTHLLLESSFSGRGPILLHIDRLDNHPAAQEPARPGEQTMAMAGWRAYIQ
jgi:hypothetical protein